MDTGETLDEMPDGAESALRAAREREKALSDVLGAIRACRGDPGPVFAAILENAARQCRTSVANLALLNQDGTGLKFTATHGRKIGSFVPGETEWPTAGDQAIAVAARTGEMVHIPDLADTDLYRSGDPTRLKLVDEEGIRSVLAVPLIGDGQPIGVLALHRDAPGAFSKSEIGLIHGFATQAVIAIENVRQFRELQTRLEREAASREILGVISRSRDDATPVFDTLLACAQRLCGASNGAIVLGEEGGGPQVLAAQTGASEETLEQYRNGSFLMDPGQSLAARAILERRTLYFEDVKNAAPYREGLGVARRLVEKEGIRTSIFVPLISGGKGIGCLNLHHREQHAYSEDQIALVETFAAQAVIAIENVRQFRELQTRLEREKATREILQVISRSRDDDQPVFEVILRNAAKLCGSPMARLELADDTRTTFRCVANWGEEMRSFRIGETMPLDLPNDLPTAIREGEVRHIHDLAESDLYCAGDPVRVRMVEEEGYRTYLVVPLISGGLGIGGIVLCRREVAPFAEADIALVESFAAQAVIAIENVRQFRELQTRLEREAATREVLQVINRSRDDEQPVFRVILENAARLCDAPLALLSVANEDRTRVTVPAHRGVRPEFAAALATFNEPLEGSDLVAVKAVADGKVVRSADLKEDARHQSRSPWRHELVDVEGVRSILVVPLMSRDRGVGAIILYRREVQPFSDDDLALVRSFAAQAVIAIENVRQFKALETRTGELNTLNASLEDRVQEQVGEIERMGKLKRFLPAAVADTVVSQGADNMLKSHRALLGVLFCDIRGFTAFCETAEPEETIEVLQVYHQEMGKLIAGHGAGVDHRMGDGIMVLFNDPLPCDDPAGDAVRLAMAMREKMAELCRDWKKLGHRLGFGVGISLGYATVGMVGHEGRSDYTASGTAVNLAARLCDRAGDGEILLSPRAAIAVEDDVMCEPGGVLELKGLSAPVEVIKAIVLRADAGTA